MSTNCSVVISRACNNYVSAVYQPFQNYMFYFSLSLYFIVLKNDMHFNIWDGLNKMQMNFQMYPLQEQFNRVT